jgi:hypothetical protein
MMTLLFLLLAAPSMTLATNINFLQVEGMMLGYYPELGDGVRVETGTGAELKFSPGKRCFDITRSERSGVAFSGISFEPEEREAIRNKLTGMVGYPGVSSKELKEDWLRSASGLVADFYRDNLATKPGPNAIQLLFLPVLLSPKPLQVVRTEWTPEAKQILEKQGWAGLEQHCGSYFVEAVGEENYVVYSIRINFPGPAQRLRVETVRLDRHNQSPGLVLNNLLRMNQRFEFGGPGHSVTVDVLVVGGQREDFSRLGHALDRLSADTKWEKAKDSVVSRSTITCSSGKLDSCEQMAQVFLDYQFGRNTRGEPAPALVPVRFRIAPLKYLQVMNY